MAAEEKIKETLFKYFSPNEYEVFLFGSRAMGNNRKWSDYDIGILGKSKIPTQILTKVEGELEDSDIPYKVGIVDFTQVSDKFKRVALKNRKLWNQNKK